MDAGRFERFEEPAREAEGNDVLHPGALKPPGEWNQYEIICRDQSYSVRLNGKLVIAWTDPTARTDGGYIGLQNYDDKKFVRHRNLRIKPLRPTSAP